MEEPNNIIFPVGIYEEGTHNQICRGCNKSFMGDKSSRVCEECHTHVVEYWNSYKNPMSEIVDAVGLGVKYFSGTIFCGKYGSNMLELNWYEDRQITDPDTRLAIAYEILSSTLVDDIGKFIAEAINEKIQREMEKLK